MMHNLLGDLICTSMVLRNISRQQGSELLRTTELITKTAGQMGAVDRKTELKKCSTLAKWSRLQDLDTAWVKQKVERPFC